MTEYRAFEPRTDLGWTLGGLIAGLIYGFLGVACVALLFEGFWIIMLGLLPLLLIQLVAIFGFHWLWNRNKPKLSPAPRPWLRHHALAIGAIVGAALCFVSLLINGPILGEPA